MRPLILVAIALLLVGLSHAQFPQSPCPDTFWYERDPGGGWHGVLRVNTPPWFTSLTITLSLASRRHLMSVSGVPPGNLTLRGGEKAARAAINEAAQGRSYALIFDALIPAVSQPSILNATVDGRVVCIDIDTRDPPSTVWLQYSLRSTPGQLGNGGPAPGHPSIVQPALGSSNVVQPALGPPGTTVVQPPAPGQVINIILPSNGPPQISYPSSGSPYPSQPQPPPQPYPQPNPEYPNQQPYPQPNPEYPNQQPYPQPNPEYPNQHPQPQPPQPQPQKPRPQAKPQPPRPQSKPQQPSPQPPPQWPTETEKPPVIEWPKPPGPPEKTECGRDVQMPNQLVLNGPKAKPYSWPWHTAIYEKQNKQDTISFEYKCGGTLVSIYFVLTAAHCATSRPSDLSIFLGKYDISSLTEKDQQLLQPDYIIIHPEYYRYLNDVALLRLSAPAAITATVGTACLWSGVPDLSTVVGQVGWVPGWGKDGSGKISTELRVAGMPIVSQETCLRSDYFYANFTSEKTFCAGFRNGTGVCNGDSGGGLFLRSREGKWLLRGIVSLARTIPSLVSCDAEAFVVFSDVAKFSPWIQKTMSALQPRWR